MNLSQNTRTTRASQCSRAILATEALHSAFNTPFEQCKDVLYKRLQKCKRSASGMPLYWLSQALQYRVAFHLLKVGDFTYDSHHPCVDAAKEASMKSCLIMMSASKKNPDNKNTPCVDALKLYQKVSEKNPDNKNTPCVDALKK